MHEVIELACLVHVAQIGKSCGKDKVVALHWRNPFSLEAVSLAEGDFLFLDIEGLPVPYRLARVSGRGERTSVVFTYPPENMDTLLGCRVYVQQGKLVQSVENEKEATRDHFLNLQLFDSNGMVVGTIRSVDEYTGNVVLGVERPNGDEVLIPYHDALVVSASPEREGELWMQVPDGLIGM